MMLELITEAKTNAGSSVIPARLRKYGKMSDRKDGRYKFEPFNAGRKRIPEGRYQISIDTKVMEPALHVGTLAWVDPSIWPQPGNEVIVHAKGGTAWIGVLVSLKDDEAHITRLAAEPIIIEAVVAVHVIVLSERLPSNA